MPKPLSPIERRVVGVLIEKGLATPQYYPLTLNSLTTGCNQKNNRDPEMDLLEGDVQATLDALQPQGLAIALHAEGARALKWKAGAKQVYGLEGSKELAMLAELLLRGPQTKAELKTRAARMAPDIAAEDVDRVLAAFAARPEPLAFNLGRAPGGRAERYAHGLYSEEEVAALKAGCAPATGPGEAPREGGPEAVSRLDHALAEIEALRARVDALERDVAELQRPR